MATNGKVNGRWTGIERPYTREDVERLRGTVHVEHTLARLGAERLWKLLQSEPYVPTLGALTGGQAVQMVKAGLKAIYLSGWQVAADANLAGHTYPDQSLYPSNSGPGLVRRLNNALLRADQIHAAEGDTDTYWRAPRQSTSRTSSPRRRNAATSAGRCSCRPGSSCGRSRRRGSLRTFAGFRP